MVLDCVLFFFLPIDIGVRRKENCTLFAFYRMDVLILATWKKLSYLDGSQYMLSLFYARVAPQ